MNNVKEIAGQLSKKGSVPAVGNKMTLIQELQGMDYWKDITVLKSEQLRLDIRSLVRFIEKSEGRIVYTDFEDEFAGNIQEHQLLYGANNLEAYKKRVTQFIQSQQHHLTIYKLCMNIPITISEIDVLEKMLFAQGDVGSREQIEMAYGKQPLGKFIRSIVGLDVEAAKTAFGSFVNSPNLNPQQIRFVDTIIQYLTVNGTIDGEAFFEPPFTDISSNGLVDVFNPELSASIISLVEVVNRNAVVA